eukprot:2080757-Rhodomonas_salina.1
MSDDSGGTVTRRGTFCDSRMMKRTPIAASAHPPSACRLCSSYTAPAPYVPAPHIVGLSMLIHISFSPCLALEAIASNTIIPMFKLASISTGPSFRVRGSKPGSVSS